MQRLWAHCADVLVIIEPGTPTGSAAVREARSTVLRHAARRTRAAGKHLGREAAAERAAAEEPLPSTQNAAGVAAVPAAPDGVHVVAPCAHERRCPMERTQQWCHFVQRVQRPAAQRIIKGGAPARTYQVRRHLLSHALQAWTLTSS